MKNRTLVAAAATTILSVSGAQALITYIDADFTTNTTLADGTAMVDVGGNPADLVNPQDYYTPGNNTISPQFHWGVRDRTDVNGTSVIVAAENNQNGGAETDASIIKTSVNVANGTYNVYVYWQGAWAPYGGLSEGSLSYMADGSETVPTALDFTNPGGMQFPGFGLKQTQLANVVVTGGVLEVYIDDNRLDSTSRVWYDGIGYEAIPEPSSVALFGMAGLGLLARRRRK